MSARIVRVPLRPGSDGDATRRPTDPKYRLLDPPTLYLEKVAAKWIKERGEVKAGVLYTLESLPNGYALYERPRASDPKHLDKYLFGHPSGHRFDSPNRFYPHFKYLMDNDGANIGCPCTVCNAKGASIPSLGSKTTSASGSSTSSVKNKLFTARTMQSRTMQSAVRGSKPLPIRKGRRKLVDPGMDASSVDDEGTPDVYRNLINKLRRQGNVDDVILEPLSMDWRAEQVLIQDTLDRVRRQPHWIPRAGELVLFLRVLPPEVDICRNADGEFTLWNRKTRKYIGPPTWEAGIVGQPPVDELSIEDLVHDQGKATSTIYHGLRVEPLPKPNSKDKSISKRHTYIPLHNARPFIFWKELVGHIPKANWHSTIQNALTVTSSFSLMGKHRFKGTWPEATVFCHGIFLGSELYCVGDVIRLLPKQGAGSCTDILVIKSIRLKHTNLDKASDNDYDEGRPYNSTVHLFGKAYTLDQHRTDKRWFANDDYPQVMKTYPDWYPLHPPDKEMCVPLHRVLGRLFESQAMVLWFLIETPKNFVPADLSEGVKGIEEARQFSIVNDMRIDNTVGETWFWGDNRAESLDLQTVNGLEVGKHDTDRNPTAWRRHLKVLDSARSAQEKLNRHAALGQRGLRGFMAPASAPNDSNSNTKSSSSSPQEQEQSGSKRGKVIELSSPDASEDEKGAFGNLRAGSVHQGPAKKAKVQVMIRK